jgi:sugar lactone lactonase YvrE
VGSLLYLPSSVAFDSLGNMYISDQGNGRIRRIIASSGIIETYAGIGARGFFGDGGPASGAQFDLTGSLTGTDASPAGKIAIGPDKDEIYVADSGNNRIRHIELATGIIETVAGNGTAGYAGDGGPATSAELNFPTDVAVGPDHSFYIADSHNHVVRKVDLFGRISTVAGTGVAGFSGDGGAATSAKLNLPDGVFVDESSVLYIADTYNHVVRRVQL